MLKADDPLFNINFVGLIEKRPCIWNQSLPDYSKRHVIVKAWAEIAKEVKDTPSNCRERWRHIRGAFLRSLKNLAGDTNSTKKKYYLDDYLQFIIPYTRTRSNNWNLLDCYKKGKTESDEDYNKKVKTECDEDYINKVKTECDEDYIDYEELVTVASPSDSENHDTFASASSRDIEEPFALPNDTYNDRKRKYCLEPPIDTDDEFVDEPSSKTERNSDTEDANMLFLRSLLPDMIKMTDKQSRRFRQKVIGLMDAILDDDDIAKSSGT